MVFRRINVGHLYTIIHVLTRQPLLVVVNSLEAWIESFASVIS